MCFVFGVVGCWFVGGVAGMRGAVAGWAVCFVFGLPLGVVGCWGFVGCCVLLVVGFVVAVVAVGRVCVFVGVPVGFVVGFVVGGFGRGLVVVGVPFVVGFVFSFGCLGAFCCVVLVCFSVVCCFVCVVLGVVGCVVFVVGWTGASFPYELPRAEPGLAEQTACPALSPRWPRPWVDFLVGVWGGLFLFFYKTAKA